MIDFGSLREIELFLEGVDDIKGDSAGFHDRPIAWRFFQLYIWRQLPNVK